MDGREPVDVCRHGSALALRNRNQRHFGKGAENRHRVRQVEPSMQRRHAFMGKIAEEGMLKEIDMKMDHVEFFSSRAHLFQHGKMMGDVITNASKPQTLTGTRNK